jgi:hypothetical protein
MGVFCACYAHQMAKRRTNLTLNQDLYDKAQQLMSLLHHSDFVGLVEQLIREEWERRHGPLLLEKPPPEDAKRKAS